MNRQEYYSTGSSLSKYIYLDSMSALFSQAKARLGQLASLFILFFVLHFHQYRLFCMRARSYYLVLIRNRNFYYYYYRFLQNAFGDFNTLPSTFSLYQQYDSIKIRQSYRKQKFELVTKLATTSRVFSTQRKKMAAAADTQSRKNISFTKWTCDFTC